MVEEGGGKIGGRFTLVVGMDRGLVAYKDVIDLGNTPSACC